MWDARRRRRFVSHFLTWFVVNAGLFLIDLVSGGGWWFFWPLLAWGIPVALHAVSALRAPSPDQIAKVNRKERRRIEAERRRAARRAAANELRDKFRAVRDRRPGAGREFERSVEAGVSALLEVVAKRIDTATGRDQRPLPDSEFNRYVAQKKKTPMPAGAAARQSQGEGGRGQSQTQSQGQGPRVRVEPRDREEIEDDPARSRQRDRDRRGRS